jgi:hypothetical protein
MSLLQRSRQILRGQLKEFDQLQNVQGQEATSTVYIYKMFLAKEKALYMNLNMMQW